MSAELAAIWPVITTGIVILIAIAASHRSMRRDMSELRRELGERIDGVQRRLDARIDGLGERIDGMQRDLGARIDVLSACLGDVRERLGRVEGLVEGIGFWQRQRDGKGHGNQESGPP